MSPKRKVSVSNLSSNATPKKVRRSLADIQAQVEGYDSDDDQMEGVDQPCIAEETVRPNVVNSTTQPSEGLARLLALYDRESDEKAKRWTELVFSVFAKENFKQDLSGLPGRSTTTGPLTNAQLRDAYCTQFKKEEHPRTITYAPRQGKAKQPRSKEKKPELGNNIDFDSFPASEPSDFDARERIEDESNLENLLGPTKEAGKQQHTIQTQILAENRRNINSSDMPRYTKDSGRVGEDRDRPWVDIRLADSFHRSMGAVSVPTEHLGTSLAYLEFRKHTNAPEIWLTGVSLLTLQRYVQCLSPIRLWKLPQCDFALRFKDYDRAMAVSDCNLVDWNFKATLDLYELASQLRDCHVRNLVLEYWRAQLQANDTYEVGLVEMQLLYDRLAIDDPALQFWTQALQDLLPLDEAKMVIDLVDGDAATSVIVTNKFKDKGDDAFHSQYHRCPHSDEENEKCHYSQNHHTEALYSFDDFNVIVRRLIRSEGWPEEDGHVQSVANILKIDLFNKYSALSDGTAVVID
ncbi:hypothetical protein SLS60_007896 [Paraconiothyrium brasiliense]|uniref:Uncharacterized protein n=1 Tax=Paraconiothyrium brasiliense TaxID=300254 RepID=A0ABR3R2W3_9PLEO